MDYWIICEFRFFLPISKIGWFEPFPLCFILVRGEILRLVGAILITISNYYHVGPHVY